MAVRKRDMARRQMLDHFIATHQRDIARILREYHVPTVEE
jgi:hypothetical protein